MLTESFQASATPQFTPGGYPALSTLGLCGKVLVAGGTTLSDCCKELLRLPRLTQPMPSAKTDPLLAKAEPSVTAVAPPG